MVNSSDRSFVSIRSSDQLLLDFLDLSDQGFFEIDVDGNFIGASGRFARFVGVEACALKGTSLQVAVKRIAAHPKRAKRSIKAMLLDGAPIELEVADGSRSPRTYKITVKAINDEKGSVSGYLGCLSDISELRVLTRTLVDQAHSDVLTGVGNRRAFSAWIQSAVDRSKGSQKATIVAIIDLTKFTQINESYGHLAGDSILVQTVRRLESRLKSSDKIARMNGDEFGILFSSHKIEVAREVCQQIIYDFEERAFVWQGREVYVSLSIGISETKGVVAEASELLHQAHLACQQSKSDGVNSINISRHLDEDSANSLDFLSIREIEAAIASHRLHIVAMPIARITNGLPSVYHHEVLVRLRDGDGHLHAPGRLIASAERLGVMGTVDQWIINKTLEQLSESGGVIGLNLNINLSGQSLSDAKFGDWLLKRVDDANLWPGQFCFEITETSAVRNMQTAFDLLQGLRERGCRVALDDFGSGLASFAYLMKFEADYLKIDGSIVSDVANDPTQRACVSAIVGLARAVRAETVAEYVEDEHTLNILRSIGVDYVQGHWIGRPVDLTDVAADAPLAVLGTAVL